MPPDHDAPDPTPEPLNGALAADAVVAHAAAGAGHDHPVHPQCDNCGTTLVGPFCHRCGQHDIDFHRSFGHMVHEALENFFHFDAKLFRNILTLLFRPGRLTADFNAGRRAAQMPPFRLYLFVSVLFFFASFLGHDPDAEIDEVRSRRELAGVFQDLAQESTDAASQKILLAAADEARAGRLSAGDLRGLPEAIVPKVRERLAAGVTPDNKPKVHVTVNKEPATALERFLTERGLYALEHQREFQESFLHALPRMLLFCLPLLALYTRFLFRRSGQVYLQHLIIALHYHTFVYLWGLVGHGWAELAGLRFPGLAALLSFGAGLWMTAYPVLMFRELFGQSWLLTIGKTLLLTVVYGLTICLGFLTTAFLLFI